MKYAEAASRRSMIVERLRTDGFVPTPALARSVGVSEMTVRRDLQLLQAAGVLQLVHGGAAFPGAIRASPFDARQMVNIDAKKRIARRAAESIGQRDTVALDNGTTAHALAGALPQDFEGCIVTSSIPILELLMERAGPRVIALGGELHLPSRACIGPIAVEAAARLRVQTFFLGAAALDARGVYVSADLERPTKLALMAIAERVVLLADRSKSHSSAPILLCPLSRVHSLITDEAPIPRLRAMLKRQGVTVVVAET